MVLILREMMICHWNCVFINLTEAFHLYYQDKISFQVFLSSGLVANNSSFLNE